MSAPDWYTRLLAAGWSSAADGSGGIFTAARADGLLVTDAYADECSVRVGTDVDDWAMVDEDDVPAKCDGILWALRNQNDGPSCAECVTMGRNCSRHGWVWRADGGE